MRCSISPANRLLRVDPPTVRNWTVIQMPFLRIGEEVGRMSPGHLKGGGNRVSADQPPPPGTVKSQSKVATKFRADRERNQR